MLGEDQDAAALGAGMNVNDQGQAFLAGMPEAVARQRDLLSRLLAAVEAQPAVRWLELGCSLARGAGDGWSDIDAGAGIADPDWGEVDRYAGPLTTGLGPAAEQIRQQFPGRDGKTCWHYFTLYDDGSQLSLVLMPASWRRGLAPGSIALYDADGLLATAAQPGNLTAGPDILREWAGLGWIALADLVKYLARGSLWEAYQRLDEARTQVWQLWAAGHRVTYPGYGLTSVLDQPGTPLPPGIDRTVAALNPDALRAAAVATAALLDTATAAAARQVEFVPPNGLRRWVLDRLPCAPAEPGTDR
jgi:hypothetical protein